MEILLKRKSTSLGCSAPTQLSCIFDISAGYAHMYQFSADYVKTRKKVPFIFFLNEKFALTTPEKELVAPIDYSLSVMHNAHILILAQN